MSHINTKELIKGGIMKDLKDTRVQKIVNEAYSVFIQMYNSRYPDIYFNGDCVELDQNGIEFGVKDTYGHYMIVNNKDYYAINVHSSIENLGYNNYEQPLLTHSFRSSDFFSF